MYLLGFPSIFVAIWIVLKAFHKVEEPKQLLLCKWMTETKIDWIIHIPAAVCLIINFIFLIRIMFVSSKKFKIELLDYISSITGFDNKTKIGK